MQADLNWEICSPDKEVLLGIAIKSGDRVEIINDYVFPNDQKQIVISVGLLFLKLELILTYDKL